MSRKNVKEETLGSHYFNIQHDALWTSRKPPHGVFFFAAWNDMSPVPYVCNAFHLNKTVKTYASRPTSFTGPEYQPYTFHKEPRFSF
jgi:hypothetical protein